MEVTITAVNGYGYDAEMVELGELIITNSTYVNMLNQMMQETKYADYAKQVKISGTTARAKWYGGNRGGGMNEDFPEELMKYINEQLGR